MRSEGNGRKGAGRILVTAVVMGLGVSLANAQVTPSMVMEDLLPGESINIPKSVVTPPIPPNPDIVFLSDTTGSMGPAIANVRTNASAIMNAIIASQPTAQFAVAEYRDIGDAFTFRLNQSMTSSTAAAQAAINTWNAAGGGDFPEAQIPALNFLATSPSVGFRTGSTRIIVWFGDAPGHNPRAGISLAQAIAALNAASIQVVAVDVGALNSTGQAVAIANATGGSYQTSAGGVASAIIAGLMNLPITVTPTPIGCGPLTVSFAPPSRTVTSGATANFVETITAPTGFWGEVHCSVDFVSDSGNVIATQQVWIDVLDVVDPTIVCPLDATLECPADTSIAANGTATANDDCDPNPMVTSSDSSTGGCGATGSVTRTWTATDASGNSTSCDQVITVVDTTAPEVTCSATLVADDDDDGDGDDADDADGDDENDGDDNGEGGLLLEFSSSDACGIVDVSAVIALDCVSDDDDEAVPGDIPVTNGQSVDVECDDDDCEVEFEEGTLEIEASGAVLIVTATDECGNTATCTVELCADDGDD